MPDLKWTYCPEEIEMMQQINGGTMLLPEVRPS